MKSSWEQVEAAAADAGLTLPLSWVGLEALCEAQGMEVRRCSVSRRAYVCEVAGRSIITLPAAQGDAVEALAEEVAHILAIRWNGHRIEPVREQPRSVRLFLAGDGRSEAEAALIKRILLGQELPEWDDHY